MRCFIAIPLPAEIRQEVVRVQDQLHELDLHAKWVEHQNLHITLKFLGEVDENLVEAINKIITDVLQDINSFSVDLADIGGFPSLARPRVLWQAIAPDSMSIRIIERLEQGLEPLGFSKDSRKPHPHITLVRIKGPKNIHKISKTADMLEIHNIGWNVSSVCLFKSTLTSLGSRYEALFSQPLI